MTIGKSNEGRDLVVVFVGSDESIRNLETYRGYLGQLADPRTITTAQADGDHRQGEADLPPRPADCTAARSGRPRC